ncbi:MAG: hypothetical protein ACJAZ1_002690, partial [Yoonia sp.]
CSGVRHKHFCKFRRQRNEDDQERQKAENRKKDQVPAKLEEWQFSAEVFVKSAL